jgi:hypothetical protein
MDPELNARLTAIEQKLEDTFSIVRKMRRTQRNANLIKIFYWSFVILVGLGAFYYVTPYLSQLKDVYSFGGSNEKNTTTGGGIIDQLKGYKEMLQ